MTSSAKGVSIRPGLVDYRHDENLVSPRCHKTRSRLDDIYDPFAEMLPL